MEFALFVAKTRLFTKTGKPASTLVIVAARGLVITLLTRMRNVPSAERLSRCMLAVRTAKPSAARAIIIIFPAGRSAASAARLEEYIHETNQSSQFVATAITTTLQIMRNVVGVARSS